MSAAAPERAPAAPGKEGFILAAAAWVIAIVALGLAAASIEARSLAERVTYSSAEMRDRLAVFSAAQEAIFTVATAARSPRGFEVRLQMEEGARPFQTNFGEIARGDVAIVADGRAYRRGDVLLALTDADALIDLEISDQPLIEAFLDDQGAQNARAAAAALLDWRDEDDQREFSGAERFDYERAGRPGPANRPLRSPDEARAVLGWGDLPWRGENGEPGVADMLTASGSGRININMAAVPVLAAATGFPEDRLRAIVAERPFETLPQAQRVAFGSLDPFLFTTGGGDGVRIDAVGSETGWRRRVDLQLTGASGLKPWRLDYMKESREPRVYGDVSQQLFPVPGDPDPLRGR